MTPSEEDEVVEQAGREFLQHLKDISGELTEDERNALDAQCDEAMDAELRKVYEDKDRAVRGMVRREMIRTIKNLIRAI